MAIECLQTSPSVRRAVKPYKGIAMEGMIANWYAKIRERDKDLEAAIDRIQELLPDGGRVLEVAPGPGYLAIELARLGKYQVYGLDISRTFVEIAQNKAREAGVQVEFLQGNASGVPFAVDTFDLTVCRAAFKNFTEPVQAICEMHRVLKPGGKALIIDLRRDASLGDINATVKTMGLNRINTLITKWIFKHVLLRSAYSIAEIRQFVSQTNFTRHDIRADAIGMEIRLEK